MKKILYSDLESVARYICSREEFNNASFLVTGATGYVGSFLVRALLFCNSMFDMHIHVIAQIRSKLKAQKIYGDFLNAPELSFFYADFENDVSFSCEKVDYVVHAAAVTSSKKMIEKPVETILTSINSTKAVLDYAAKTSPKSVIYISSMEMYGEIHSKDKITEEMLGYLNPLTVRSDYPESKRMCENLCVAYYNEFGVKVKIARLAQVFGTGILPGENRVFAQFANAFLKSEDIVLHTTGESEGNYCYISDAIKAILLLIIDGKDAEAYNVANEEMHSSIRNMAKMVAETIAEGKIRIVYDIPKTNIYGYAPAVHMKLDASKLCELGWEPTIGMEEAYRRMLLEMGNQ